MFSQSLRAAFASVPEMDVHPHVPEERAHLFHALDGGSAELEVLTLLNALIYAYKPRCVLETGTHRGFSAIAITSALKANGSGILHTVECDRPWLEIARENLARYDAELERYVTMHCSESTEWLSRYRGPAFDFAFLDSSLASRWIELQMLKSGGLLSPEALVMCHDTSRYRGQYFEDYDEQILMEFDNAARNRQCLTSSLSRGFQIFRAFC